MQGTWRATAKAGRRAEYLSAAARLFAQRGFHGVSIDELGAAVGASGPALYRHFESKEAMLTELLVGASERLLRGMRDILDESVDDREKMAKLIDFHVEFALAERDIIRIQDRELEALPRAASHQVRKLQRQYVDAWTDVAARLLPDVPREQLIIRMHAIFGLLNSTPHSARGDLRLARDILARLAREGLIPPVTSASDATDSVSAR